MSKMPTFKSRLNDFVTEKGLSRKELAEEVGIAHALLSNYLNYGILPKPKTLIALSDYFNCSIDFLLGYTDDEDFEKSSMKEDFHCRFNALVENFPTKNGKKLTAYRIMKKTHIVHSSISLWLSKNYLPSLANLYTLADFFGCNIDYLLGRTDVKTKRDLNFPEPNDNEQN